MDEFNGKKLRLPPHTSTSCCSFWTSDLGGGGCKYPQSEPPKLRLPNHGEPRKELADATDENTFQVANLPSDPGGFMLDIIGIYSETKWYQHVIPSLKLT